MTVEALREPRGIDKAGGVTESTLSAPDGCDYVVSRYWWADLVGWPQRRTKAANAN
jgi:hypothetical protein